jgi:hypothetical protein
MNIIKTKALVLLLGFFLVCSGGFASADDHGDHGQMGAGMHRADVNRHSQHYYHNGRWYRHGWFGVGVSVPVLSTGVYVDTVPPAYTPVVVQGATYYYGDNTYFSQLPQGGYTVVTAPR